jgi:hypothetical protein
LFVSNPTEFQNSYGITLPSTGLYLADCEWDIPGSTFNDINVTKLLINEQRKIDSKYLDLDTSELSKVAFSGDYNDLTNKPEIVYPVTSVAGKTGVVTLAKEDVGLGNVENKSSATIRGELTKANVTTALGYTPPTENTTYDAATTSAAGLMSAADKTKLDGIATGANKTIVDSELSGTSTNPVQNKVINTALNNKLMANGWTTNQGAAALISPVKDNQTVLISPQGISVTDEVTPTNGCYVTFPKGKRNTALATLADIPTPPTVNNGTLIIQKNGTEVATFTANQSEGTTANIIIPTKTSELTNDSGFKTVDTTYDVATTTTLGLVKSSITGTTANRDYAVEVNSDGTMKVNVPWVNTQDGNDNQTVKAGTVTFGANDPIDFVAGNNVTVTGNKTEKKITIGLTNVATLDENGHVPST